MIRPIIAGLIALSLVMAGHPARAQSDTSPAKSKCVPAVPSAGDVLVTGGEDGERERRHRVLPSGERAVDRHLPDQGRPR